MLFNSIEELKAVLGGIQKTMFWATWEPFVRQAELKFIIPAIGQPLYDELTSAGQLTADQKALLQRLRPAVAYFAYLEGLPFLATATGDAGLLLNQPANTAGLTKWMYVTLLKDLQGKSDFWLEESLQWLETHAVAFPKWVDSDAYTIDRGRFIHSATMLTSVFPAAKSSRRLYTEVRGYLLKAEDFIRPVLTDDFHDALLAKLTDSAATFTPKEAMVLKLVREAVASHAFEEAIPYMNMNADFRIVSETDGVVNEDELEESRLNIVLAKCRDTAAGAVAVLTKYLNANASSLVFPEYFRSANYRPPVAASAKSLGDSSDKFFAM